MADVTLCPDPIECDAAKRRVEYLEEHLATVHATINNWLPSLDVIEDAEYNERTGGVTLTEEQWGGIREASIALRTRMGVLNRLIRGD